MDPNQPVHSGLQIYLNTVHECTVLSLVQNITRSLRTRFEEIKHICMKRSKTEVIHTQNIFYYYFKLKTATLLGY